MISCAGHQCHGSSSLSHWYAMTSNQCAPRKPDTITQVSKPRM